MKCTSENLVEPVKQDVCLSRFVEKFSSSCPTLNGVVCNKMTNQQRDSRYIWWHLYGTRHCVWG